LVKYVAASDNIQINKSSYGAWTCTLDLQSKCQDVIHKKQWRWRWYWQIQSVAWTTI